MKNLVTASALTAALLMNATLANAQTRHVAASGAESSATNPCSNLRLTDTTASVRLGGSNLAQLDLVGGSDCAATVQIDNENVTASIDNRENGAVIRIIGQREGFSKVSVFNETGKLIGSVDVNVYPREYTRV